MKKWFRLLLVLATLSACTPERYSPFPDSGRFAGRREGLEGLGYEKVMIIYTEGYNNLTVDIEENLRQLDEGYIPGMNDKQALLVYAHNALGRVDYSSEVEPVVYRIYSHYDKIIRDTIRRYPSDELSVKPERVKDVLSFIKQEFSSQSYGLVFNSHASGWIPKGYDSSSDDVNPWSISPSWIGSEFEGSYTNDHNLDVDEFAQAIPMHLDYIVFDCCLMGGVETNYSLREKTNYIVAAPTEVISEGFDYYKMTEKLLKPHESVDLKGVCVDFFEKFANGSYATVALYDCSKMDELAKACKKVFSNHPDNTVLNVNPRDVQDYNYSFSYHYDFRDILAKMGASTEELAEIDAILEELVIYKNATPYFINTAINPLTYSGMSMYLPTSSRDVLNSLYKETPWNKATGLLK